MPSVDGLNSYTVSDPWTCDFIWYKASTRSMGIHTILSWSRRILDAALRAGLIPGWKSVWENPEFQEK